MSSPANATIEAIASTVSSAKLETIVVKQLADAEINRLASLLAKGIQRLTSMQAAFVLLNKPDQKHFTNATDATPSSETFSDGKRAQVVAAQKEIDKLQAALDKAFTIRDFTDLSAL